MMLTALIMALPGPLVAPSPLEAAPLAQEAQDDDPVAKYEELRSAAGTDKAKLWEVWEHCDANGLEREARSVLRAILDVDDSDAKAHELLGHVEHEGEWFTSQHALDRHLAEKLAEEMAAKGLAKFEDEWVPIEDLMKYERGFVPHEEHGWVRESDLEKIEKGWVQVDLEYVPKEELQYHEQGLYKCGDKWLSEAEANEYHGRLLRWWKIPMGDYVAYSTCARRTTEYALQWMSYTHGDLVRFFGIEPDLPSTVILLRSQIQYNAFASTSGQSGQIPPEGGRAYSSVHHTFLCESWIDVQAGNDYPGAACTYWDDTSDKGNRWGQLAARHAGAQAFVEGIDPSPETVRAWKANPTGQFPTEAFWAEKKLPLWMRYGAASYCERYFLEAGVPEPDWARRWSVGEISRQGGLDDLNTIFAFGISPQNPNSGKLINEAGLIVAFILDAKVPSVLEKHGAFKQALKTGEGLPQAIAALQAEIVAREAELRGFAGFEG